MNPTDQLVQLLLTSRLIDVGAILVSITAIIVTTRNAMKQLTDTLKELTVLHQKHLERTNRHEIEIERIKERCTLLHERGEGCA